MAKKIYIDWRPEFAQTIRSRGMDYYRRGTVNNVKQEGSSFSAEVTGSGSRRYMTFAHLSEDFSRVERLSCTCPYALEGKHCKHEAALMYLIEDKITDMISGSTLGMSSLYARKELDTSNEQDMLGGEGFYIDDKGFVGFEEREVLTGDKLKDITAYRYYKYSQILKSARISKDVWVKAVVLAKSSKVSIQDVKLSEFYGGSFGEEVDDNRKVGDKICSATGRIKESYFQAKVSVGPDYYVGGYCYVPSCKKPVTKKIAGRTRTIGFICEHKAALLYLLKEYLDQEGMAIDATDRSGEDIMKQLSRENKIAAVKESKTSTVRRIEKYDIEPILMPRNNSLYLAFRLSGPQKFKVQHLNELYYSVKNGKLYKFGRKNIRLSTEALTDKGLKIYEFIENFALESDFYTPQTDGFGFDVSDDMPKLKDEIPLFGHFLDEFYDLCIECGMQEDGITLVHGRDEKKVYLSEEPIQAKVQISNMKDGKGRGLGIHVSGFMPVVFSGRKNAYYIEGNTLNKVPRQDVDVLSPLTSISHFGKFEFRIGVRNLTKFYYDTLPWLRDHALVSFEDADWLEQFILPQAEFTFFLDREKGFITCKAVVSYDNLERNLLYEAPDEESFRDLVSEGDVIDVVRNYFPDVDTQNGLFICDEVKNEDLVFELLSQGLDELQVYGDVRHTESFMSIGIRKNPGFQMGVSLESSLLDLEISAEDMDPEELIELLNSYRTKKKYYRLKSGDFVSAQNEAIENLVHMLDNMHVDLRSFVEGKMQIPAYRALYLDRMLEDQSFIYEHRDRHFKKLIQEFKTISDAEFDLPSGIDGHLRKYQRDGYRWLRTLSKYGFGGILADEMGLGKTLQTIALLASYYEEHGKSLASCADNDNEANENVSPRKPSLVVVPASLVYNWGEELKRFAPSLNYVLITGSKPEREDIILNIEGYDVAVTSYDLLKRDIAEYEDHSFAIEIIDEAQYIKNHLSQAAKSVKLIRADRRFALTGTPIENRLSELWSIFDYLMPGLLYSYPQFRADFEIPVMKYEEEDTMDKLRGMVTPFILRRKKADVLKDLPDKLEEIRYARMDEEQQKLYDAQVVHMKMRLEKQSDEEFSKNKIEIFAELTRLRQICCDPALCFENYKKGSCKTDVFMDMIEQVIEGEHKALVFSQFVTMLDILKGRLESAGIPYYEITGATPKEKRIELVNAFNQDKTPVFLISLKAGGTGLNLTGADVVIHYDPWWNIAVQNQATDRAHRIGQRKVVTVFKLIAHGTIEDKILEMQEKKRALAENILESDGISSATLSRDDLLELLN